MTTQDHLTNLSRKDLIDYARINNLKTIEGLMPDQKIKLLKSMDEDQIREEIRRVETLKVALQTNAPAEAATTILVVENTEQPESTPLQTNAPAESTTILMVENTEQPESTPAEETPKKEKSPKKPGVIQFIIDTHIAAYPDGLENLVAEQMLAQQFPERNATAMASTLKLQPRRLRKQLGLNVIPGIKGGWCIAPAEEKVVGGPHP